MKETFEVTSIERSVTGAWKVSGFVDSQLVTRTYYGYTKREAMRLFREEARTTIMAWK